MEDSAESIDDDDGSTSSDEIVKDEEDANVHEHLEPSHFRERTVIQGSKVLVYLAIILAIVGAALSTYFLTKESETDNFHREVRTTLRKSCLD